MAKELTGKRVAFLTANEGVEQVELTGRWEAVQQAGRVPVLVALESGNAQAFNHLNKSRTFNVDVTVAVARVEDSDALVLPGGAQVCTAGPSTLVSSRSPDDPTTRRPSTRHWSRSSRRQGPAVRVTERLSP
jgi:putative intracellular protease/amidase